MFDMTRANFYRYAICFLIWVQLFGQGKVPPDELALGPKDREYYIQLARRIHESRMHANNDGAKDRVELSRGSAAA